MSKNKIYAYNKNMDFWEYSLCVNIAEKQSILYIKDKLKKLIKKLKGVITTIYTQSEVLLVLGVPTGSKMQIKPILLSMLADVIIKTYKTKFILNHLDFCPSYDISFNAFLNGLCFFDMDIDREYIYQKLLPFDNVNIDSFFDFRLKFLKSKWKDLVSLANDNYLYLLSSDNFFELLKFLLSNLECREDVVKVELSKDNFKLYSQEKLLNTPAVLENKSDLIASLIYFCPKTIVVQDSQYLDKTTKDFLFSLFENKLKIIK